MLKRTLNKVPHRLWQMTASFWWPAGHLFAISFHYANAPQERVMFMRGRLNGADFPYCFCVLGNRATVPFESLFWSEVSKRKAITSICLLFRWRNKHGFWLGLMPHRDWWVSARMGIEQQKDIVCLPGSWTGYSSFMMLNQTTRM